MNKANKTIPKELILYYERLGTLDDQEFADEFLDAESLIDLFLNAVHANSAAIPSRSELTNACMCLDFFVLMQGLTDVEKDSKDIVRALTVSENCISYYTIAPKIEKVWKAVDASLKHVGRMSVTHLDGSDDLF